MQIEQEISLIVGKKDIRTAFETSWTTSYVSALLKYAQRSKKKAMRDIFMKLEETGVFYIRARTCVIGLPICAVYMQ